MVLRYLTRTMAAVLVALSLLSCQEGGRVAYGQLSVGVDADSTVEPVFKSTVAAPADMAFSLKLLDKTGTAVAEVSDHRSLADSPLTVRTGKYTIQASNASAGAAAWDAPFYAGSTEVTVKPDMLNKANIVCSLANVKVTCAFSDAIKSSFKSYSVNVSNGEGSLTYAGDTIDGEGFFSVTGNLSWTITIVNADDETFTYTDSYSGVKAAQHYNFNFDLQDRPEFGAGAIRVVVSEGENETYHDLTLDFSNKHVPVISANFSLAAGKTIIKGENSEISLNMNAVNGISSAILTYPGEASKIKAQLCGLSAEDSSALNAAGIHTDVVEGATSAVVNIGEFASRLEVGSYQMSLLIVDTKSSYASATFNLEVLSNVEVRATRIGNIWAKFTTLFAEYYGDTVPSGATFQYRKANSSIWTSLDPSLVSVNTADKSYSAVVSGLDPSTEYVIRAVSAKDSETPALGFTTDKAETIQNLSFDDWYKGGSAWYPNKDSSVQVWDTANPGTASLGAVPTTPEETDVIKGKAAKLESTVLLGQFAAGNIYIGKFGKVAGLGAEMDWGIPFTSRPTALKGWYKYNPQTVTNAKAPYESLKGQKDQGMIHMVLTDWTGQFHINTSTSTFFDFSDSSVIAYGAMPCTTDMSSYEQFTIPLEYRTLDRMPRFVVIVAAASRYGDYFTGGKGSILRIDEFELSYDYEDFTVDPNYIKQ